jgi:hypothetical protein
MNTEVFQWTHLRNKNIGLRASTTELLLVSLVPLLPPILLFLTFLCIGLEVKPENIQAVESLIMPFAVGSAWYIV